MQRALRYTLALLLVACGSSSDSNSLPDDAQEMLTYLKTGVILVMPRLGGVGAIYPVALNPGSPGAENIEFEVDPSPGAPAHSYVFTVHYDGDADGNQETTFTGSVTFTDDPANVAPGFGGHVNLEMETAGGLGTLTGEMDFTLGAQGGGDVSGTGTFTESITGNSTTLTVDQAHPLHIEMAKGTVASVSNACASSLEGNLALEVEGTSGSMTSTWGFVHTRSTARVTGASFTDNDGKTTDIPDQSVTIPCGQEGKLRDWNGEFEQHWACAPAEFGSATLTLTASGNQVSISDEDPPGSGDVATYDASPVPGNPRALRGFFIGGPPGATYREDFSWLLSSDGRSFAQISRYVYQEGPNQGSGGYCGGTASK